MKSQATFRRHPVDEVVPHTKEDRKPWVVVPYGKFGGGVWTGHRVGLIIVIGIMIVGFVGIPEWRWFFGAALFVGSLVGYVLYRRHS